MRRHRKSDDAADHDNNETMGKARRAHHHRCLPLWLRFLHDFDKFVVGDFCVIVSEEDEEENKADPTVG